jgi:hypothetical protein
MTERTRILSALETDWNISGIKKVWKYLPSMDKISESDYPSIHIAYGTETKTANGEDTRLYELPVLLIVFFSAKTDTSNQGLLRIEAERWIDAYKVLDVDDFDTLRVLDEFVALEYVTGTPYLNTGVENKGFLLMEYKLTYIGD